MIQLLPAQRLPYGVKRTVLPYWPHESSSSCQSTNMYHLPSPYLISREQSRVYPYFRALFSKCPLDKQVRALSGAIHHLCPGSCTPQSPPPRVLVIPILVSCPPDLDLVLVNKRINIYAGPSAKGSVSDTECPRRGEVASGMPLRLASQPCRCGVGSVDLRMASKGNSGFRPCNS
jgi:hypothetical protein